MSDHFKNSLKLLGLIVLSLLAIGLWLRHRIKIAEQGYHTRPVVVLLPKNDRELITYNENRHIISVTTAKETVSGYTRNPTVEIRNDGTVVLDTHKWGTEVRPFLGVGYSDTGRVYLGCQLLYFHQFDAAASFGWTADNRYAALQPMLSVSWNFYSNTSLHIGANPIPYILQRKPEIAVFLSVRL